ncbi:MAG: hypothetical protein R2819_01355 [Allomuricauda sp.]
MKTTIMKTLSLFGVLTLMFIVQSCSKDDDAPEVHELVGTWQRVDLVEDLEERYIFHSDKTGTYLFKDQVNTTNIIFNWIAQDNVMDITYADVELMMGYEINSLGQLVINGDDDLTYNRIQ